MREPLRMRLQSLEYYKNLVIVNIICSMTTHERYYVIKDNKFYTIQDVPFTYEDCEDSKDFRFFESLTDLLPV